jgi:hypothetical protein
MLSIICFVFLEQGRTSQNNHQKNPSWQIFFAVPALQMGLRTVANTWTNLKALCLGSKETGNGKKSLPLERERSRQCSRVLGR